VIAIRASSRRRLAIRGLLLPALLAGALASSVAHPGGAQAAQPLVTGIAGIGEYQADVFGEARSSGARMVRLALNWDSVAPAQQPSNWQPADPADPHYDWGYIDKGVREAVNAGLTPVLLIDGAPQWAQRCKSPPGIQAGNLCDPDPAALEAFAKAAASRYSGHFGGLPRVQYWQGLNEPNLTLFFFPQFNTAGKALSPYLYRQLINAFYAGIKSIDPTNLVLAAGLGPIAVKGWTIGPMRFARMLLCMHGVKEPRPTKGDCEGGVHFDIFDIHPYTTGGPTHEGGVNDLELGDLDKIATLLKAADRAGRIKGSSSHTELWNTEFSWDSNPPDPGGLEMKILCRWTAEALYRSWRAGMTHFFWYSIRDDPPEPSKPFSQTLQAGLYLRGATVAQDQPKEVLQAFRFPFVAYPAKRGLSFWGRTPTSEAARVRIQLWKGGRWLGAGSARAGSDGIFQGVLPRSYGRGKRGLVRAVFKGQASVPFSMHPVADFRQPPFG
jgi:hypothetical protein